MGGQVQSATDATGQHTPTALSLDEVRRVLQTSGNLTLKTLIKHFKPFISTPEQHRQFVDIVRCLTRAREHRGHKILMLRAEHRSSLSSSS